MSAPAPFVIGIDLGGTKIRAGIAGAAGGTIAELERATAHDGARALAEQIVALAHELCALAGIAPDHLTAVGLGGAGVPVETHGGFELAPNLDGLDSFDLVAELSARLACPVALENDVNVAALGELAHGIGREHDDFAFISVGTGIGMGLVLDRRLVRGAGNAAGEIGYLPFGADPLDPTNHRRGALEEAVAGDVLAARYGGDGTHADARDGTPDGTHAGAAVTARTVFDRAAVGDARALAAIDEEGRWLASAIAAVAAVADPGRFVLGGGIGSRSALLAAVHRWLERLGRPGTEVTISALGSAAPVLGAVQLARDAAGAAVDAPRVTAVDAPRDTAVEAPRDTSRPIREGVHS